MLEQPIDFISPPDKVEVFRLPVRDAIFSERAKRLKTLASGHKLADWLLFISHLTHAQHVALQALDELALPSATALEQARIHGMPPLNATAIPRPELWRNIVVDLIDALTPLAPAPALSRLNALRAAPTERLEKMADDLLKGHPDPDDFAELLIIAAALQVVWTALSSQLETASLGLLDPQGICPCCGSLPVASMVRISSSVNNLRYLHCSLCNSEWNVARATCTACNTDKGVVYEQIEGSNGAARAECCDSCQSYLKIFFQEKDPAVDPVADDLATLALDMLVDEAGYSRSGPNLFLLGGAG